MRPISEQYLLSPCEIKSMENVPILTGYLSKIADGEVRISSKDDTLPLVHCNSTVKVGIYNSRLGIKVLVGKVYLSTDSFIRVVEVQSVADYEKRGYFRVKVDLESEAYLKNPAQQEDVPNKPFKIMIHNISLSGLFFISSKTLGLGDNVVALFKLYDKKMSILCQVMRKIPVNMGTEDGYGCKFLENNGKKLDLMCKYLYDCQRKQIQLIKQHP